MGALRVSEQPRCALTFVLGSRCRGGRRGGLGASCRRLGAGGPRARPPIPLFRTPGDPLLREGAEDPVVLGKSQDGFDAMQPRGAPARAAEQVAGEREAAVGHGWGAAGQVHGERRDAGGRGPRSRQRRLLGRPRAEAGSRPLPGAVVQPEGS